MSDIHSGKFCTLLELVSLENVLIFFSLTNSPGERNYGRHSRVGELWREGGTGRLLVYTQGKAGSKTEGTSPQCEHFGDPLTSPGWACELCTAQQHHQQIAAGTPFTARGTEGPNPCLRRGRAGRLLSHRCRQRWNAKHPFTLSITPLFIFQLGRHKLL